MNRKVINGVAALCMAGMLLEPVMTVNAEELLTAGVGDLFSSELTEDQYKKIAKEAEGTRWGYTELGICNVEENNLNICFQVIRRRKRQRRQQRQWLFLQQML